MLVGLGLVLGGWALGAQIRATRLADRYVSVRGLAERTVKSDLAIWNLEYTETGDELPALYTRSESDRKIVLQFLKEQGIVPDEIGMGVVQVLDNQAREYGASNKAPHRYLVQQQITVQTARVDQVAAAAQKTVNLLQQGVVLNTSSNQGLAFRFNGLNSIKPDMITEATRNARAAADRFAVDADSRVGTIRNASQGIFSISSANTGSATGEAEDGGVSGSDDSSIMKKVRVVTSVEYFLEK
ncbi:MAG: SIMPL domain-containing protein [Candidatus Acidiferrales bacterium]